MFVRIFWLNYCTDFENMAREDVEYSLEEHIGYSLLFLFYTDGIARKTSNDIF